MEIMIVKVKFTNYQSVTDAVAQLKKNDLQEIFRELQVIGTFLELAIKNPTYVSSNYITYARSDKLISSTDSVKYLKTPDKSKMSYYVQFGEMSYDILEKYYSPADYEVNYCGFIEYWIEYLYPAKIIDLNKDSFYMGFYSELFCFYPAQNKSYFAAPTTSSSRYGYNFETNQKIYFATIRQWFDWGSKDSGLTTYISTYLFAGGAIGATMSKAFMDSQQSMRGVINYDFLPYSSPENKNTLISKLLFGDTGTEFDYLLIDQNLVADGNFDIPTISTNLASMVYATPTDSSAITSAKAKAIQNSFSVSSFNDVNGNTVTFCQFTYNGDKKYLFNGDIKLVRARSDESSVIELINELGFISSSATIDNELNAIVDELTSSFITINILICFICLIFVLMLSILASRYLADFIMNEVIRLCVKMKLAQTAQAKMLRNQSRNQKVEFSQKFYDRTKNVLL